MQQREEKEEDDDESCHGRRVRGGGCVCCDGKEDKDRLDEGAMRGHSGGADEERAARGGWHKGHAD